MTANPLPFPSPVAALYIPSADAKVIWVFAWNAWLQLHAAHRASGEAIQSTALQLQTDVRSLYTDAPFNHNLHAIVARHNIPRRRLLAIIDGWNLLLVRQRPRDASQLETILDLTGGSISLGIGQTLGLAEHDAQLLALGRAIAHTQLLAHLPFHLSEGR